MACNVLWAGAGRGRRAEGDLRGTWGAGALGIQSMRGRSLGTDRAAHLPICVWTELGWLELGKIDNRSVSPDPIGNGWLSWEKTPQEKGGLVLDSSVDRSVRKSRLLTYLQETFCQISCTTSEYTNQARYMYWYCTLRCVNGPRTHDDGSIMVSCPAHIQYLVMYLETSSGSRHMQQSTEKLHDCL